MIEMQIITDEKHIDVVVDFAGEYVSGADSGAYDKGYNEGYSAGSLPIYYLRNCESAWGAAVFPENSKITIRNSGAAVIWRTAFIRAQNLKSIKLISDTLEGTIQGDSMFREIKQLELIDLTEFNRKFSSINYCFLSSDNLKTILGALDVNECTKFLLSFGTNSLEDIEFVPNTIKVSIPFNYCSKLTAKSIQSIIDGLADLTGQTAQTVSWHSTVLAKLTPEQYSQMINKNWNWN